MPKCGVGLQAAPHHPMGSPQGGKEDPGGGSPGSCRFWEQWLLCSQVDGPGAWGAGREVFPGKVAGSAVLLPALRNVSANHCWHEATWREQEGFIAGPLFELQYIFLGWRQRGINQQLSLSHPIHTFSPQWCCLESQADHSQGIFLRLFLWMDHCGDMDFFWSGLGLG